jgi:GH18 family chitinase
VPRTSIKAFSDLFREENNRQNFIEDVKQFLLEFDFDGLDIYWYPSEEAVDFQDKNNFQQFMNEIKVSLFLTHNTNNLSGVLGSHRRIS